MSAKRRKCTVTDCDSTSTTSGAAAAATGAGSTKQVTSAIDELSIPDVRKCLTALREMWRNRSVDQPVCLSDRVITDLSAEQFAYKFTMGHHIKRHQKAQQGRARHSAARKSRRARGADAESSSAESDTESTGSAMQLNEA